MYVIQTDNNPSLECVRNKDSIDRHERSLCKRYLWGKKTTTKKQIKEFTFDFKYLHDAL